jgi:hypothetical protein
MLAVDDHVCAIKLMISLAWMCRSGMITAMRCMSLKLSSSSLLICDIVIVHIYTTMAIVGAAENPRDIVCGVAEEPLVEGGCRFHYCHLVLVLAGVSMSVTWSILMTILWSRLTKLQIARSMSPRNVCAVCHPLCASRQKSFRCLFVRQLTMSMRSAIFVYS